MTNSKTTKKALLSSVIALILCFSMLLGTTFAWFTDTVNSGRNQIQAGNLDVELFHVTEDGKEESVKDSTKLFDDLNGEPISWEPGAIAYETLTVKNAGSLAFKYAMALNIYAQNDLNGHKLSDVLKVYVINALDADATRADVLTEIAKVQSVGNLNGLKEVGKLYPTNNEEGYASQKTVGIAIYWEPTSDDNRYNVNNGQTASDGKDHLFVEIGVKVEATQLVYEEDSFGPDYDAEAEYPENRWLGDMADSLTVETDAEGNEYYAIYTPAELAYFAAVVNGEAEMVQKTRAAFDKSFAGKTVKLMANMDLNYLDWTPIGSSNSAFAGTFDGNGYTIAKLAVNGSQCVGLFGKVFKESTPVAAIKNLTVSGAKVNGSHYVGGIVGFIYGNIENCEVNNAQISATPVANNNGQYDDGDKAGGIVGYMGEGPYTISGCEVNQTTVKAYRDLGSLAGMVQYGVTVQNNLIAKNQVEYVKVANYIGKPNQNKGILIGQNGGAAVTGTQLTTTTAEEVLVAIENDFTAVIPKGTEIDLDLSGATIGANVPKTAGHVIKNQGTLNITDGTITSDAENGGSAIYNAGTLTLENVKVVGAPRSGSSWPSYAINNYGDMTVNDAVISSTHGAVSCDGGGTTVFNNTEITMNGFGGSSHVFYIGGAGTKVIVNSGTYTHKGNVDGSLAYIMTGATMEINGGSFSASNGGYGLAAYGGSLIVNGGQFTNKFEDWGGPIAVSGGTFSFDPSKYVTEGKKAAENDGMYVVIPENSNLITDGVLLNENGEYEVYNANGLYWVAEEVNKVAQYAANIFDGKVVKLISDIDLGGQEWIPIGDFKFSATQFRGTFDGQGHTVSNFKITKKTSKSDSNKSSYGLFGNVNGTIKNLTVENASISSYAYVGVLVGRLNDASVIDNCHIVNSSATCTFWQVGGLVGQQNNNSTITNCSVTGCTITGPSAAGAIVGSVDEDSDTEIGERKYENCSVKNCAIVQNGSHGGGYDALFGAMLGNVGSAEDIIRINNYTVENTTVKGKLSEAIFGDAEGCTVYVDGHQYVYIANGLYVGEAGHYYIYTAAGLENMNKLLADRTAGANVVMELVADIDFAGKVWMTVDSHVDYKCALKAIYGNGHTISNLTVNGQAMFSRFAGIGDVVIKDLTFDKATINSTTINTSILTVHSYQNVLLDNVDVTNSTITGGYKVAALIGTVYNEASSTVTATLKNCDVSNTTVKAITYDFCTTGLVAFVNAGDNDKIEFENCTVSNVKIMAPNDSYKAHAWVYTTGSGSLFNEVAGVTVSGCTFENI